MDVLESSVLHVFLQVGVILVIFQVDVLHGHKQTSSMSETGRVS